MYYSKENNTVQKENETSTTQQKKRSTVYQEYKDLIKTEQRNRSRKIEKTS